MPDRFRRVRDPNGTILTTFRLPTGPAGPGRAGSENFFGRGSRGSEKNFRQEFVLFKNGIHWVLSGFWAQKKTDFGPLWTPEKGAILPHFTYKMAKKRIFEKKFCSKSFYFGSYMVWDPQNPKISLLDPPMDPILAHFVCKKADFGVEKNENRSKLDNQVVNLLGID